MVLTVRYILKSFKVLFPALLRKWNGKETQRSKSFLEEILSRWPVHTPKRARGNFEALQKHLEAGKAFKVFIWYHRSGIQTEVVLLPSLLAPFQNRMVPSRVPVSLFRISPTQKIHPNAFLVPCYDIDLVWHTHQVHPVCYAKDCQKILGAILPHDDTDPDRSEDSKLNTSFTTTQQLWRDAYKGHVKRW